VRDMAMKGFVFSGPGAGEIANLNEKKPKEGEVLVKVKYCGVCGTDMNIWRGIDRAASNIVLGHEFCGTVVETGSGVKAVKVGDRVSIDPNIPCNQCEYCRRGQINLCSGLKAIGVDIDGGFAEYCCVPEKQLYLLPPSMPWEYAALVEPVACAINGINRSDINIGDDVLIYGGGPMGLLMVQLAKLRGAGRVFLCEKTAWRRQVGTQVGADVAFESDPAEYFMSNGKYPDVVIECIGNPQTQREALQVAKPGGKVVLFGDGYLNSEFPIPSQLFYSRELTARGAALNPFTTDSAFRIISSGRLILDPLVSRKIPLDDLIDLLNSGYNPADVKVFVAFDD